MKKKMALPILFVTTAMSVVVCAYIIKTRKRTKTFDKIRKGCVFENKSILDEQELEPVTKDDTLIMEESHNCLAKKALYDVLNKDSKDLGCDLNTLAQFVHDYCENCKRKGYHGHNLSS